MAAGERWYSGQGMEPGPGGDSWPVRTVIGWTWPASIRRGGQAIAPEPFITAQLFRVTADIADWGDTLPEGLLRFRPALSPA